MCNSNRNGGLADRVSSVLLEYLRVTWRETTGHPESEAAAAKPLCVTYSHAEYMPEVMLAMRYFAGYGPGKRLGRLRRHLLEGGLEGTKASMHLAPTSYIVSSGLWSILRWGGGPVLFQDHCRTFFSELASLQEADQLAVSASVDGDREAVFMQQRDPISVVLHFIALVRISAWEPGNPRVEQLSNAKVVAFNYILEEE